MELKLKKQPQKYLAVDALTRKKASICLDTVVQAGGRYRPAQGICEPIPL